MRDEVLRGTISGIVVGRRVLPGEGWPGRVRVMSLNRRRFLTTSPAVAGVMGSLAAGKAIAPAPASAESSDGNGLTTSPPALFGPREDGVTVAWSVAGLCRGVVEYGETDELGSVAHSDPFGFTPNGEHVIRVRLEGLKPGTRYSYRVSTHGVDAELREREHRSDLRHFTTLSAGGDRTSFVVWNDTHDRTDTIRALHTLTHEEPAEFMVWNGDISNDVHRREQIVPLYLAPGEGLDFSDGLPCCYIRGNHDVRGIRASMIDHYVDTPTGRPYYSMRVGPVAAVMLDTGEDKADDHPSFRGMAAFEALRREQAGWLADELKKPHMADAPYRVAFCHIPLRGRDDSQTYETGSRGYDLLSVRSRVLWHDALTDWGVQVVVSGHRHRFDYIEADERFPYAQLVGGGPQLERALLIRGDADGGRLRFRTINLDKETVHEVEFPPLA